MLLAFTLATNDVCSKLVVGDSPRRPLRRWFLGTPPAFYLELDKDYVIIWGYCTHAQLKARAESTNT
ncbi:MAG: hypothetical protein RMY35_009980 [Nostoc sp. DedSLP01]